MQEGFSMKYNFQRKLSFNQTNEQKLALQELL